MAALGHHILAKDPNATDIKDRLKKLAEDQRAIAELWNNKNQELIDARDLQVPRFSDLLLFRSQRKPYVALIIYYMKFLSSPNRE